MRKFSTLALFLLLTLYLFSQKNLVPNYDFQNIEKKVKSTGRIVQAYPWFSPTLANADLYTSKTKNDMVAVPDNAYGAEKPMKGDNYAGIRVYSYKDKEARSYLQVKLTEPLKKNQEYCVTAHISLADISKYACNNIGVHISSDSVEANNSEVLQLDAQVISPSAMLYEQQYYWTPVCSRYIAMGGEEFITIGNFTPNETTKIKKVKRPKGFTTPQKADAYYYVDNVSVVLAADVKQCDCEPKGPGKIETVSRSFSSNVEKKSSSSSGGLTITNTDGTATVLGEVKAIETTESLDGLEIHFADQSSSIIGKSSMQLDKVSEFMNQHSAVKIVVEAFMDTSSDELDLLSAERLGVVWKYLLSKRLPKERVAKKLTKTDAVGEQFVKISVVK